MQVLTRNWHAARMRIAVARPLAVVFGIIKQDSARELAGA